MCPESTFCVGIFFILLLTHGDDELKAWYLFTQRMDKIMKMNIIGYYLVYTTNYMYLEMCLYL